MDSSRSEPSIQPPWVECPGLDPWQFKQGHAHSWLLKTFLPFWRSLTVEEREAYLQKWKVPNEDWSIYLTYHWV